MPASTIKFVCPSSMSAFFVQKPTTTLTTHFKYFLEMNYRQSILEHIIYYITNNVTPSCVSHELKNDIHTEIIYKENFAYTTIIHVHYLHCIKLLFLKVWLLRK